MSFRVVVTSKAAKERNRLEAETRERVDAVLRSLLDMPWPEGAKKLSGSRHDWRIRVGDYRILFEVDAENEQITVWRIAHRREAYR